MLLLDVWTNLSPQNIALGGSAASSYFAGMAKAFFYLGVAGVFVMCFLALLYMVTGEGKKEEGKNLMMGKFKVALFIAGGVMVLDAVFLTAKGLW